jgi:hypothetical protein
MHVLIYSKMALTEVLSKIAIQICEFVLIVYIEHKNKKI